MRGAINDGVLRQHATAKTAQGDVVGRGTVVAYSDKPQVLIRDTTGYQFWWCADLCRFEPEEPHATEKGREQKGDQSQHQDRDGGWKTPGPGGRDSTAQGGQGQKETQAVSYADDVTRRIHVEHTFLLTDAASDSVAWAKVYRRSRGVLWFGSLWVAEAHRKKGYAAALIARVIEVLGSEPIYLEVAPYADRPLDDDALTAFYGRYGWQATMVPGILLRRPTEPPRG